MEPRSTRESSTTDETSRKNNQIEGKKRGKGVIRQPQQVSIGAYSSPGSGGTHPIEKSGELGVKELLGNAKGKKLGRGLKKESA